MTVIVEAAHLMCQVSKVPREAWHEIEARVTQGETLARIGGEFGVTKQRISQIVKGVRFPLLRRDRRHERRQTVESGVFSIYAIKTDTIRYIGCTSQTLTHRLSIHIHDARLGRGSRWMLQEAQRPLIVLLATAQDRVSAFEIERAYIAGLRSAGYNLENKADGGPGVPGVIPSIESRQRRRESQLARIASLKS